MGTPFTTGQLGKLQGDVNIAVTTALPNVAAKFPDPKAVLKAIEGRREILARRLEPLLEQALNGMLGLIIRSVKVNRTRSPGQALTATGRKLYVTNSVVAAMPRGEGELVELEYFEPGPDAYRNGVLTCAALEAEYEKNGLEPDPIAQAADNEADPAFADEHPNACQWKDADSKYCYAAFRRWYGGRRVRVRRRDGGWGDDRLGLFAGRRKASSTSAV